MLEQPASRRIVARTRSGLNFFMPERTSRHGVYKRGVYLMLGLEKEKPGSDAGVRVAWS